MTSIISEVAAHSYKLLESAIVVYAFSVEIFGLDLEFFSKESIDYY